MDYNDWLHSPPAEMPFGQTLSAVLESSWPPKIDTSKMDTGYWKKTWEGAAKEPSIHVVDVHPYGNGVEGWTICDKQGRSCEIIITRKADYDRVKKHEYMHALGWDHPEHSKHLPGYISPLDKGN